jgi:hypothetical protein
VVTFDQHGSAEVRNVGTVSSHLAFPKATDGYCTARYVGAEAIMATFPELTQPCAQPW